MLTAAVLYDHSRMCKAKICPNSKFRPLRPKKFYCIDPPLNFICHVFKHAPSSSDKEETLRRLPFCLLDENEKKDSFSIRVWMSECLAE